jgi:hypothetical protein
MLEAFGLKPMSQAPLTLHKACCWCAPAGAVLGKHAELYTVGAAAARQLQGTYNHLCQL